MKSRRPRFTNVACCGDGSSLRLGAGMRSKTWRATRSGGRKPDGGRWYTNQPRKEPVRTTKTIPPSTFADHLSACHAFKVKCNATEPSSKISHWAFMR